MCVQSTNKNFKSVDDATPIEIFGGKNKNSSINYILADDIICIFQSVGEMYNDNNDEDLLTQYAMHTCIQSDPRNPTRCRDALEGLECKFQVKSTTV